MLPLIIIIVLIVLIVIVPAQTGEGVRSGAEPRSPGLMFSGRSSITGKVTSEEEEPGRSVGSCGLGGGTISSILG